MAPEVFMCALEEISEYKGRFYSGLLLLVVADFPFNLFNFFLTIPFIETEV